MTSDLYDRAQAAVLELFGVDNVDDMTPAQRLRVEIATALKVLFDGQQNQILDGKNVDPLKVISTIDALVKLAPAPPPPQQEQRQHVGARERLAALIEGHAEAHRSEQDEIIAQQAAEIERLQAVLGQRADAAQPIEGEILPPQPSQERPRQQAGAPPQPKWEAPSHWSKSNQVEPWGGWISLTNSKPYWGPV
jgi:hypothetical protein